MCRLRAVTAAVTYVTQPISWKPRKSSGVLGYATRPSRIITEEIETDVINFVGILILFPGREGAYKFGCFISKQRLRSMLR